MFNWLRIGMPVVLAVAALAACDPTPSSVPSTAAPTSSAAPAACKVNASNTIIHAMEVSATCYTVPRAVNMDTQRQYWLNTAEDVSPKPEQQDSGRMYVPITCTADGYKVVLNSRDRSDYGPANDPAYYQRAGWVKVDASYE